MRSSALFNRLIKALKQFFQPKNNTKKRFRKVLCSLNLEERFTKIYEINYWGNQESRSGRGSTLALTANLRAHLPNLFQQFGIHTVFDGPCGDFNWMRHVVANTDIQYIGADIVEHVIHHNQETFGNHRVQFKKLDLTRDPLPQADLMICRDCLFHLSYRDTFNLLQNYLASGIPYLLTTSYHPENSFSNSEIETGHFRMIDLFSAPYSFPPEVLYTIEDWLAPEKPRSMYLWSRAQILTAIPRLEAAAPLK